MNGVLAMPEIISQFFNGFVVFVKGVAAMPWGQWLASFRVAVVYIDLFFFVIFVILWFESRKLKPKFYLNPTKAIGVTKEAMRVRDEKLKAHWEDILAKAESAPPQSLTLAIIEADSFIDDILKTQLNLAGEHMADRLDKLDDGDVKSLDKLWRAHRIRNDLVHTPGYFLNPHEARAVLRDYEKFLKEIEVV